MVKKRKGDTLILAALIITIVLTLACILIGIIIFKSDMCDKNEILKDILNGDLKIRKGKTIEESVDYYYLRNTEYAVKCIVFGVLFGIKIIFQAVALKKKTKGAYVAAVVAAILLSGVLFGILTVIGSILSSNEITKEEKEIQANNNTVASTATITEQNIARTVEENNNNEVSNEYGSEVKDDKQE